MESKIGEMEDFNTTPKRRDMMSHQEKQDHDLMDTVLDWSSDKIYSVWGSFLEKVVMDAGDKLRRELRGIWKNRTWYAWKDTGEQFDKDTISFFFDPRKIKKYTNQDMEHIIDLIERETNYSNPKK